MKRHDIDVISLMGGLLFAGLAAVFALHALGAFDVDLRATPAVALIVAGLGGIAAAVTSSTRAAERDQDEQHSEPVVPDRMPES